MKNQYEEKRTRRYMNMRSIMDFGMGILYLGVGVFLIIPEQLGFSLEVFDPVFRYMFGGLCAVYGSWRIYRGFKKDYF